MGDEDGRLQYSSDKFYQINWSGVNEETSVYEWF